MSEAFIAPTYGEAFELRRQFRQLYGNGLALDYLFAAVAPTGAQLEAWLATDANVVAYQRLIATAVGASAVCASAAAMAAVVGSATALAYLRDSDTGRAALLNSKTAMAAVVGSATTPGVVLASGAARAALYDNETAWALFIASANGRNALSAVAVEHSTSSASFVYPAGLSVTSRAVLVQQKATGGGATSYAGAQADTYTTTSAVYIDRYARVTGLANRTTSTSVSSQIRFVLMQG
ncbi:hypothetical protein [Paenacidovorax monticola]|uniref:Uncharacterized protein n=1 Tax=Paenacidovorax monticola TaxID=1926868 RepID=A0A7H0HG15_9BURK|nr:hypothetical protein [Paenacidovorax monticola]QNP59481.1 hypothetical protein H9L24_00090 [Paenacidovorax monticola]